MQTTTFQDYHKFRRYICLGCGRQVDVPVYCKNRFCPVCGRSRHKRIREKIAYFLENYNVPKKYGFRMITLSVPNCDILPDGIEELIRCFRRLRQRSFWKNNILGGAFVIEIKGTPGNWHPHIHAIVCSKYLNWDKLHKEWNRVSGALAVYISNIQQKSIVNYLLKYITKPSVAPDLVEDVANSLINKRLFQAFGDWHKAVHAHKKKPWQCPNCKCSELESYGTIDPTKSEYTKQVYVRSESAAEKCSDQTVLQL